MKRLIYVHFKKILIIEIFIVVKNPNFFMNLNYFEEKEFNTTLKKLLTVHFE